MSGWVGGWMGGWMDNYINIYVPFVDNSQDFESYSNCSVY